VANKSGGDPDKIGRNSSGDTLFSANIVDPDKKLRGSVRKDHPTLPLMRGHIIKKEWAGPKKEGTESSRGETRPPSPNRSWTARRV